jgi:nitrate/TMAO reductase-like tetraheme cytochrome c subunit
MSPPTDPANRGFGAWFWRRPKHWFFFGVPIGALAALFVGILATGAFFGTLKFMDSEAFCTSCHSMNAPRQELAHTVHYQNRFGIRAGCADCHVAPTFVAGLIDHMKGTTQVLGWLTGELDTPAKFEAHRLELAQKVWQEFKGNDSAECRSCHTPAAMNLSKQPADAASAHSTLATSGLTCIDCHRGVAHTLPTGG